MRVSNLTKPSLMFAMAGLAMPAHATVVDVDYSPTLEGTPITIGDVAAPQFTFTNGPSPDFVKDYIKANGDATIAFPNSTPQSSVNTAVIPNYVYTNGLYGATFDIGATNYAGTFTVDGLGDHISQISYDAVSTSAVPEPASWAMLLLGMGAVGAAVRARRQSVGGAAIA